MIAGPLGCLSIPAPGVPAVHRPSPKWCRGVPVQFDEYYRFRGELVEVLTRDLIGPAEGNEVISDAPITKYISGILYPQTRGESLDPSEDLDLADDYDEVVLPDPPVAMANVRYPSSMGMTFSVDSGRTSSFQIDLKAARYVELEPQHGDDAEKPQSRRRGHTDPTEWRREPVDIDPLRIEISKALPNFRCGVADGLELFCRVRDPDAAGLVPVTVVLLNTNVVTKGLKDPHSFFQPEITVSTPGSEEAAFAERTGTDLPGSDEDLRSYKLLYRHARNFATGHGCSVEWNLDEQVAAHTSRIWTSFAPQFDLKLSDTNPDIRSSSLSIRMLIQAPQSEVIKDLETFCSDYENWIGERRQDLNLLEGELRSTGTFHLASCREALNRMRTGVARLGEDEEAWRAFRLANRAMLEQRSRTDWLRSGSPEGGPDENGPQEWRPFQLAFILLCLEGIANPESPERDFADLLWFPTGGGKTEAYLGLIAFTLFLRRLRNPNGGAGVTVLMRYTLRLLTIQQFERAALLMCCCEAIRRRETDLGTVPFSIGLWVGRGGTPNTLRVARRSLDRLRQGQIPEEENPVQVHSCPWCGVPLDHINYYIQKSPPRLVIHCRQDDCLFGRELPIYVVDEDIYAQRPSLIIGTVDKFAALPWKGDVANLFNLDQAQEPRPELIIQDELHLISGPLGTLTGLYETAVDFLCTEEGVRPKIVASTATIRRAGHQSHGLFDREVRQFPAPGLDARHSYFAVEASREDKGTRLYLGLMAPGTSQTTLLVRTYAALLQRAKDIDAESKTKDPYWTLIGYFNSLRVLGGARMQVQDDVTDRMDLLSTDTGTKPRPIDHRIELTSREPSGHIPEYLKRMATEHPTEEALDVILATNMISVGVDIDRLGLMVVMGQPQSTSEYIQSTSRVGRKFPGLVVTLLNAARSRDRSHYESFVAYHSALYRQVESTSVTPFSSRARDRGIHAVLIALARLTIPGFRANATAGDIGSLIDALPAVKETILDRVRRVAPGEVEATEAQLDELIDEWRRLAIEKPGLVFDNWRHPEDALLVDAGLEDLGVNGFRTTRSLRDVDMASNLFLVR